MEANFQITSRDQHGNVLNHGGDRYDVSLTGPVCFNANVIDMDNGVYQVRKLERIDLGGPLPLKAWPHFRNPKY